MNRREIKEQLKQKLKPGRYEHTLGVEYTSACLAMRYDYPMEKADIAGLLHDCAKCLSDEEKLLMCRERKIPISEAEEKNPGLLHAKLGASLAKELYGIEEEEILSAICCHTTGKPAMTLLEKIVFVADYIEPNREHAPSLEKLRKLAFQDIDQCLLLILEQTLDYLKKTGAKIDPMTEETYQYYKRQEVTL